MRPKKQIKEIDESEVYRYDKGRSVLYNGNVQIKVPNKMRLIDNCQYQIGIDFIVINETAQLPNTTIK